MNMTDEMFEALATVRPGDIEQSTQEGVSMLREMTETNTPQVVMHALVGACFKGIYKKCMRDGDVKTMSKLGLFIKLYGGLVNVALKDVPREKFLEQMEIGIRQEVKETLETAAEKVKDIRKLFSGLNEGLN